jgi:acyl carrier protein
MELEKFIKNFASQFDETDASKFSATTEFKQLDEWSSIIALSIIAMVDEEYNAKLKGNEIKTASTIEDLFNIVKGKI